MADDDASASDTDGGLGGDKKDTPAQKKQVKNEHILIAVGIVTLLVTLLYLRKNSASSSGSSSVAQSPYGVNSYGTSGEDPYGYGSDINTLANDLQSMQSEIAGLTPPTTNSGSTTPSTFMAPAGQVLEGGGYGSSSTDPVTSGLGGATYVPIENGSQLAALGGSGTPIFWQPSPGDFEQISPGMNLSGIPTFTLQSGTAGK